MCKYLAFKGAEGNRNLWALFFQNAPHLRCASYFNLGRRSFRWGIKWWLDWILGPCDSVAPPIGRYGVRLIRLWSWPC